MRLTVSDGADEADVSLASLLAALRPDRLRLLTALGSDDVLRAAHAADVAVDRTPITADGRFELVHWVREQAVSITRHRLGRITPARSLPSPAT